MNDKLSGLYQRICDYSPDDGKSAFTFTQRLARDNSWDLIYARRVVEEYKRFMFLAVVAGHPVTPSEQVDQAWHLNLIYTRSYWDDLCGQVLGMPIHHGPTKGGADEHVKFCDLYERTKASYEKLFNETPPPDIWPAAERRFGEDVDFLRVNTRQHWIVSKARAKRYASGALATVLLVAVADYAIRESASIQSASSQVAAIDHSIRDRSVHTNDVISPAFWTRRNKNEFNDHPGSELQHRPRAFAEQSYLLLWGVSIGAVAASFFGFAALFRGKCSSCGRAKAMKKTGRTRRGTGWWATTQEEWSCNHCGAAIWTTHFAGCGSGCGTSSGCGGTTHCGGSDAGCGSSGCAAAGCGGGGCGGGGCGGGGCGGG
jgi:hypothetical protein